MINNLILLATAALVTLGTMFSIVLIESSLGLHQLFFVGDVELVVVALVIALLLTTLSSRLLKKGAIDIGVARKHFMDCALLYLVTVILVLIMIGNSPDLQTAYLFVVTVSCVAVTLSHLLLSFLRYRSRSRM